MKTCPHCGKELPKVTRTIKYNILFNYETAKFEGINGEVDIWQDKYPAIAVVAEIKKAEGWALEDEEMQRFIIETYFQSLHDKLKSKRHENG